MLLMLSLILAALGSPATGDTFPAKALIIVGIIALLLIMLSIVTKKKT